MRQKAGLIVLLSLLAAGAGRGAGAGKAESVGACLESSLKRELGRRQGAGIVLETGSGKVVAAARGEAAGRRLLAPGSAVKPFTLVALVEGGAIGARTEHWCRRKVKVGARELKCTHPELGRPLGVVEALALSCNSYFAEFVPRLRAGEPAETFRRFGLTSPVGGLPGEVAGEARVARTRDEQILQALGVTGIEVTVAGLARGYRNLANWMQGGGEKSVAGRLVREGLAACVEWGTCQAARVEGLEVGAKTGTARRAGAVWTQAWLAGFLPLWTPELAFAVLVESGSGAADAAPLAGAVWAACQERLREARTHQERNGEGRGGGAPRGEKAMRRSREGMK